MGLDLRLSMLPALFGLLFLVAATTHGQLYSQGEPTPYEQYLLEMVNAARANPSAEASRLGIELNQGLSAGTISAERKQPLVYHPVLIQSARYHSSWMLATGAFSHTGANGSSPTQRASWFGYSHGVAENIAYQASTTALDLAAATRANHESLFRSPDHRINLLADSYGVAGFGQQSGALNGWNVLMLTQNFSEGGTGIDSGPFVTGVVYNDSNANGAYDPGEGVANVQVTLDAGSYYTASSASGGFAIPLVPQETTTVEVRVPVALGSVPWSTVRAYIDQYRAQQLAAAPEMSVTVSWSGAIPGSRAATVLRIKRPARINYTLVGTDNYRYPNLTLVTSRNTKVDLVGGVPVSQSALFGITELRGDGRAYSPIFGELSVVESNPHFVWSHALSSWLSTDGTNVWSYDYGWIAPGGGSGWVYTSSMGWVMIHGHGAEAPWVFSWKYGWIRSNQDGTAANFWSNNLQAWVWSGGGTSAWSSAYGWLVPLNEYGIFQSSSLGTIYTGNYRGWVWSPTYNWMNSLREGTASWFENLSGGVFWADNRGVVLPVSAAD